MEETEKETEKVEVFQEEITAIAMNHDFIALGTNTGYKIFSMQPIKFLKNKDFGGSIGQIGFYNSDNIIWFVGGCLAPVAPDNELRLWDNWRDEQLFKIAQKGSIKKV